MPLSRSTLANTDGVAHREVDDGEHGGDGEHHRERAAEVVGLAAVEHRGGDGARPGEQRRARAGPSAMFVSPDARDDEPPPEGRSSSRAITSSSRPPATCSASSEMPSSCEHLLAAEGEGEDHDARRRLEASRAERRRCGHVLALGEGEEDRDVPDGVHDHEHGHEGRGEEGQVEGDLRHGRASEEEERDFGVRAPATETAQQARLLAKSSSGSKRIPTRLVGSRRARPAPPSRSRPRARGSWLGEAVEAGGATIVEPGEAERPGVDAIPPIPTGLGALLDAHPQIDWVQLPWAGIEPYVDVVRAHAERTWTCGKGVYAEPVAEHALALALAGLRQVGPLRRAARVGRGSRGQPARRTGGDPRRRRDHREPAAPARARSAATSPSSGGRRTPMDGADPGGRGGRARRRPRRARRWWCSPWPSRRRRPASSTGAGSSCCAPTRGW